MYTRDQLLKDIVGEAVARRDVAYALRAYGVDMSRIVKMHPEERVERILKLQEAHGYRPPKVPTRAPVPVESYSVRHKTAAQAPRERTIHWRELTMNAALGAQFDGGSLGRRELLKLAMNSDGTSRLYCKTYHGYRPHADTASFLRELEEQLCAPIVLQQETPGHLTYHLVNKHSAIYVSIDVFKENQRNHCRPYNSIAGTPSCDGITVCIDTLEPNDIVITDELCNSGLEEQHEPGVVEVLVQEGMGISVRALGKVTRPLIRENYSEQAREQIAELLRNITAKSPVGRLTIVNGDPGTGKTHLLQGLLHELEGVNSWFVPPQLLVDLAGPQLLGVLLGRDTSKPLLMLVEDGDNCLVKRMNDNMSSIQALLNIADGFIGQMLNIHVIVTTNARNLELDQALLRPGRLHQQINIGALEPEHANQIYKRLTGKEGPYNSGFMQTLAQVYKDAAGVSHG